MNTWGRVVIQSPLINRTSLTITLRRSSGTNPGRQTPSLAAPACYLCGRDGIHRSMGISYDDVSELLLLATVSERNTGAAETRVQTSFLVISSALRALALRNTD